MHCVSNKGKVNFQITTPSGLPVNSFIRTHYYTVESLVTMLTYSTVTVSGKEGSTRFEKVAQSFDTSAFLLDSDIRLYPTPLQQTMGEKALLP